MHLKINPIFSQRDPKWSNFFLGYNTSQPYTLGNYGCLITCYAMYLSSIGKAETPQTVNDKLKANNGYVNGGLLVWSAPTKIWGITPDYISPYYEGPVTDFGINKMKALLDEGKPLICHVDFDPMDADDDMHWVLVYGYDGEVFHICDPWTGRSDLTLDLYGGVKRAVLEFRTYTQTVAKQDEEQTPCDIALNDCQTKLEEERKKKQDNWNWGEALRIENEGLQATITTYKNYLSQLAQTVGDPNADQNKILGLAKSNYEAAMSAEDRVRQAEKKVEDMVQSLALCETQLTKESERADNCFLTNKEQSEALQALTEENKKLNDKIAGLKQEYSPVFRIFNNLFLCVREEGEKK